MYKYHVYLKVHGVLKNVVVSAKDHKTSTSQLTLYEDEGVVAQFRMSEILGWVRVLKNNK